MLVATAFTVMLVVIGTLSSGLSSSSSAPIKMHALLWHGVSPDRPRSSWDLHVFGANSSSRPTSDDCFVGVDYGILDGIRASAKDFCVPNSTSSDSNELRSSYTYYRFDRGNLQATVFRGLQLDLSKAQVKHDISSIAEDGGEHDPRYKFESVRPLCQCETPQVSDNKVPRVWFERLTGDKFWRTSEPTDRPAKDSDKMHRACEPPKSSDKAAVSIRDPVKVLLIARVNDHNPFLQISQTLDTWIMMKALDWSNEDTQIVYLDKGIPSPMDELRHLLLAPLRPAARTRDMLQEQKDSGKGTGIIEFGTALIAPYEWTGPMTRHLDNYEPCARTKLIADFRSEAMAVVGVEDQKNVTGSCVLTIISRRDYEGRKLQRVWVNEQEVLDRMIADFGDRCTMRAVDFVGIPIAEQIRTIVNSDIVVGMHGAGMANVMWTRPDTLVIEIFPKPRRRWGFRNICQHVGCNWHGFRGGEDIITERGADVGFPDPNTLNKVIPPDEWAEFANPLLRSAIARTLYVED